jgi:hypothetical protein
MTKSGCCFYALQTDFWANERPKRRNMVTFAKRKTGYNELQTNTIIKNGTKQKSRSLAFA